MKSALETLGPTRVKLTVEVPFEELRPSLDAAYTSIGSQIQVPGFRRGHIPNRIIEQRVGKGAVLQEAVNEALPQFYGQALQEHDVRPMGQPEVDVTEVPIEEGQPLTFSAEVDCRPQITLPDFATLAVTVDPLTVTDEDIAERVESLRMRFGTLVGVERPAATGDFVSMDLAATIGDEQIDEVSGVSYEVGSHSMLDGLDEALVGLRAGESTAFTAALAGGDRAGEHADCTVTVQSVKVRELPELDDAFAQLASEFDTLEELQADLAQEAERAKRYDQGLQARDRVMDALIDAVDVPLPDAVVDAEVHHHLEEEERLEDEEHRAEVTESTRKALKAQLLLDAVVEQENVAPEQAEIVEYLLMTARQYGMDPNQFAQAVDGQGQIPAMYAEVARRKALATVLERATVTDTEGNVVDLAAMMATPEADGPDGGDAADAPESAEAPVPDGATDES
ncbi:MAG: trigger factor [Dermatophilaceae bacterium]